MFIFFPKRVRQNYMVQSCMCVCVWARACVCVRVRVCACSVTSNSFVTSWHVACHGPLSMELSRQEYWSGLPFLSPGDLLTQGPDQGLLPRRQILYPWATCKVDEHSEQQREKWIIQRRVLGQLAGHLEQNASWLSSGVQLDPRSQSKRETVKRTVRKQSRVVSC